MVQLSEGNGKSRENPGRYIIRVFLGPIFFGRIGVSAINLYFFCGLEVVFCRVSFSWISRVD